MLIPSALADGRFTLKVLSEFYIANYITDYAYSQRQRGALDEPGKTSSRARNVRAPRK